MFSVIGLSSGFATSYLNLALNRLSSQALMSYKNPRLFSMSTLRKNDILHLKKSPFKKGSKFKPRGESIVDTEALGSSSVAQ